MEGSVLMETLNCGGRDISTKEKVAATMATQYNQWYTINSRPRTTTTTDHHHHFHSDTSGPGRISVGRWPSSWRRSRTRTWRAGLVQVSVSLIKHKDIGSSSTTTKPVQPSGSQQPHASTQTVVRLTAAAVATATAANGLTSTTQPSTNSRSIFDSTTTAVTRIRTPPRLDSNCRPPLLTLRVV
jgi:hypothetical protein